MSVHYSVMGITMLSWQQLILSLTTDTMGLSHSAGDFGASATCYLSPTASFISGNR